MDRKYIMLLLPEELKEEAREKAKEKGISLTAYVRMLIIEDLKKGN